MDYQKKNCIIEFLRFISASVIILFHISIDLWENTKLIGHIGNVEVMFFRNGYIAVEFFFLVSGYLLAKSVYKRLQDGPARKSVGEETISFLWAKAKAVLPYYLPICGILTIYLILRHASVIEIIKKLPNLLFLQSTGAFNSAFMGVSWYISSMLIAMAFIYPLCRKYYKTFTTLIAPICGTLIIGAIIYMTGNLGGTEEWAFITYKTNFRALAEVALGTTCFEVSRRIRDKAWRGYQRTLFTIAALFCYAFYFFYVFCNVSREFSAHVLYLLAVGITITFSGAGWIACSGIFQHRIFAWLGAVSLPMYLFQNVFRKGVPWLAPEMEPKIQCVVIYLGTFLSAAILYVVVTGLQKRKYAKKSENRSRSS